MNLRRPFEKGKCFEYRFLPFLNKGKNPFSNDRMIKKGNNLKLLNRYKEVLFNFFLELFY